MPRPKDLPHPVRHHDSHEDPQQKYKAALAPGPNAYRGYGLTKFDRDHRLGVFLGAPRFRKEQLVPEDLRTKGERDNFLDTPGPIYTYVEKDTTIPVSFAASVRRVDKPQEGPGPGEYIVEYDWKEPKTGVSFTKAKKFATQFSDASPAPGTYNPQKLGIRRKQAFIGSSPKSQYELEEKRVAAREDAPPLTPLDAIDRATNYTKRPFTSVSFTKAPRFQKGHEDRNEAVGPGAYDITKAANLIGRCSGNTKIGSAPRHIATLRNARGSQGPGFVKPVKAELLSQYSTGPRLSFPKDAPTRGVPNPADTDVPSAIYNPELSPTLPNQRSISMAQSHRLGCKDETPGPGPAPQNINIPSTLGGPKITFPKSRRDASAVRELISSTPGPGEYKPQLPKRPGSGGISFPHTAHSFEGAKDNGVPGPKYSGDYTKTRYRGYADIKFSSASRSIGLREGTFHNDVGPAYTPQYSRIDRDPRSAILYLTG